MTDTMKVKALAPWFGGKRTMAPLIVQELGPHKGYWEIPCGGMSVLLSKPPCGMETVCDLHGDLTNLALVIQNPTLGAQLYRRLRRTLLCEEILHDACDRLDTTEMPSTDAPSVDRAYWYYIQSWMMRSGVAGTAIGPGCAGAGRCIAIRYTTRGGSLSPRWMNAVDSIPAFGRRMRSVLVMRKDMYLLLPKIDDEKGSVLYSDPTYLRKSRSGLTSGGATSRYLHEMQDSGGDSIFGDDHTRLSKELNRFENIRVVVSYYDHPRLTELYPPPKWTFVKIKANKNMAQQGKRGRNGSTTATEVLIINGPSYTENQE